MSRITTVVERLRVLEWRERLEIGQAGLLVILAVSLAVMLVSPWPPLCVWAVSTAVLTVWGGVIVWWVLQP